MTPNIKPKHKDNTQNSIKHDNSYLENSINEQEYQAYVNRLEEEEQILEAIEQERLGTKALTFIEDLKRQALNLPKTFYKGFRTSLRDLEVISTPPLPTKIIL